MRFLLAVFVGCVLAFVSGCYTVPPQQPQKKSVVIEQTEETTKTEWKETLDE